MTTKLTTDNINTFEVYDNLVGLGPQVSNVVYTDGSYTAIEINEIPDANANLILNGYNFNSDTRVLISNTSPSELVLVSDTQLKVKFSTVPVAADGTVILRLLDTKTGRNRIYLDIIDGPVVPVWITGTNDIATIITDQYFSTTLVATAVNTVSYSLESGTLSGNITLNTSTGVLSGYGGTTTYGGYSNIVVRATDTVEGTYKTRTFAIKVDPQPLIDAFVTGSNVSTIAYTYNSANYIAHVFLESGTFEINAYSNIASLNEIDMFVVGGGAGGAGDQGGGGGGGVANNYANVSGTALNTEYTIQVGGGGGNFGFGGNTSITGGSISLFAGGGGAAEGLASGAVATWYTGGGAGGYGGSGGQNLSGGVGLVGYNGGSSGSQAGGGGGGMGSAGSNGGSYCNGGMGGNGIQFAQYAALAGSPAGYFGGGGRGGAYAGSSSVSTMTNTATGGGGDGKCGGSYDPGTGNGDPGTGGGGGGGIGNNPGGAGAGSPGGSGIVIVRYPCTYYVGNVGY